MSFKDPGFFEEMRMEWLWNRLGTFRYKKYIQELQIKPDGKALDFGCGGGAVSRYIAEALSDGKLVCLDTSDFWLTRAKKRMNSFSNVEYICKELKGADLPDGHFDFVFIHFVLHDIDKVNRQEIIDSLADKIKEEGYLYIREPTRTDHGMSPAEIC